MTLTALLTVCAEVASWYTVLTVPLAPTVARKDTVQLAPGAKEPAHPVRAGVNRGLLELPAPL